MDNDSSGLPLSGNFGSQSDRTRNPVRSVCWIDAYLEYSSPTMVHLLHALPHLREAGWEIEAWCFRSDAPRDQVRHVFLPTAKWLGPLEHLWFFIIVNLYGIWRRLDRGRQSSAVIHATCGVYFGANLISVHFVNAVWATIQIKMGL